MTPGHKAARAVLATLSVLFVLLAVLPATVGSKIVLATAGGSPDWLLGPFRFAGLNVFAGANAGWIYYAGLLIATGLWISVVMVAERISAQLLIAAVVGLHVVFVLAPPLLSQDVFSYIAYARLGVVHDLNPYLFTPYDMVGDPVFGFSGSKDATNVYGPLFTLASYPLANLSVPAAFWTLKAIVGSASLALCAVVWRSADKVGVSQLRALAFVGLCPATLVHVVGGAHNEALVMLVVTLGVAATLKSHQFAGPFIATMAAGIKASAALVLPFLVLGSGNRKRAAAAAALAAVVIAATGILAFGVDSVNSFAKLSANQGHTSKYSVPHKTAQGLAAILPGDLDFGELVDPVRIIFIVGFAVAVGLLLLRTWRRPTHFVNSAAWASLLVLLATAWLVPWYILWVLPFAALSSQKLLLGCTAAMTAYAMAITIPF